MKTKEVRADRQQSVRQQGKQDVKYWIDPLIYPGTMGRYA